MIEKNTNYNYRKLKLKTLKVYLKKKKIIRNYEMSKKYYKPLNKEVIVNNDDTINKMKEVI